MTRLGLVLAGLGFLGATAASDIVTLMVANLVIGAGLGAVYATAPPLHSPPPTTSTRHPRSPSPAQSA